MPFCVDCFAFDLMPTIAILVTFASNFVPVLLHAGAPARLIDRVGLGARLGWGALAERGRWPGAGGQPNQPAVHMCMQLADCRTRVRACARGNDIQLATVTFWTKL